MALALPGLCLPMDGAIVRSRPGLPAKPWRRFAGEVEVQHRRNEVPARDLSPATAVEQQDVDEVSCLQFFDKLGNHQ